MKLAILLSAIAGTSAFAPASQSATSQTRLNAADLDTLRGVGPETGNKVVSKSFSVQNTKSSSLNAIRFLSLEFRES